MFAYNINNKNIYFLWNSITNILESNIIFGRKKQQECKNINYLESKFDSWFFKYILCL